jgi:hypothetical protein
MALKVSRRCPLPCTRVETELTSPPLRRLPLVSLSTRQYPKIVSRVQEEDPVQIPSDDDPDVMVKNPNGTEFDNLYLDVSRQLIRSLTAH